MSIIDLASPARLGVIGGRYSFDALFDPLGAPFGNPHGNSQRYFLGQIARLLDHRKPGGDYLARSLNVRWGKVH
jgi:hypothetical protein